MCVAVQYLNHVMPTNPLAPYVRAMKLPGALAFTSAGLLARLPLAMVSLGVVLYVSNTNGSYAFAGSLQALFAVAAAIAAIFSSRYADQYGQQIVLRTLPLVYSASLVIFVVATHLSWSPVSQAILVAIAGATYPSFGSFVRARWTYVTHGDPGQIRSAFALESILDELIFTVGPLVATTLAFSIGFASPLIAGALLTLLGSLILSYLQSTTPPRHPHSTHARPRDRAIRHPGLFALVVSAAGVGILFGSFDVSVVAFTAAREFPEMAGITLGLWALGSMLGGVVFGSRHFSMSLPRQLLMTAATMAVVASPLPFITSIPVLVAVAFLSGVAIAPTLISTFALAERLVPARLLTEGLTWVNSGLAVGFALGASLSGFLIDRYGTLPGFALGVVGAGTTAVIAIANNGTWMRHMSDRQFSPVGIALNAEPVPGPAAGGYTDDPEGDQRQSSA